jgi:hypothetical protein
MIGKGGNMEIDSLSKKILASMIFEETFEKIMEDCGEPNVNIVRDVIRTLIVKDLVKVYEYINQNYVPVPYQDPDYFKNQYLRITAKGIKYL